MNEEIRILLVDDHPVVRAGLQGLLSGHADFMVVGEAADGGEAGDRALQLQPDVILMDLHMTHMDGVEAITRIKARLPATHVLVLTTFDSDADILHAIEAGATGYLLKDVPRDDLFHAIRAAANGESILSPAVAARLMGHVRSPSTETLSLREIEVLTLVAKGASNKEIAHHLDISEATVKTHLIHIFNKLDVSDRTQAVTVAVQRGIVRLE